MKDVFVVLYNDVFLDIHSVVACYSKEEDAVECIQLLTNNDNVFMYSYCKSHLI
jgi:hypothetical protein